METDKDDILSGMTLPAQESDPAPPEEADNPFEGLEEKAAQIEEAGREIPKPTINTPPPSPATNPPVLYANPREYPWNPMKDEPSLWYGRFCQYKELGEGRSVLQVYKANLQDTLSDPSNVSPEWRKACKDWNWVERAQAWDAHLLQMAQSVKQELAEKTPMLFLQDYNDAACDAVAILKEVMADIRKSNGDTKKLSKAYAILNRLKIGERVDEAHRRMFGDKITKDVNERSIVVHLKEGIGRD